MNISLIKSHWVWKERESLLWNLKISVVLWQNLLRKIRKQGSQLISFFQQRNLKFRCREAASGIAVRGQLFFWLFWSTSQLRPHRTHFTHWAAITLTAPGPLPVWQIGISSLERNSQAYYQFITSNLKDSQFVLMKATDKGKNTEWISFIFSSLSAFPNISCKQA